MELHHREAAYALLRITFGVVFLFSGIGKLMGGVTGFVGGMNQRFAGKLPAAIVMPFSYTLPFAELWNQGAAFLLDPARQEL